MSTFGMMRQELRNRGGIQGIIRKNGWVMSIDLGLSFIFGSTLHRLYKARHGYFGLSEAFLCPRSIDWCTRYISVAGEIARGECHSVLDVGGGGGEISRFLPADMLIYALDVSQERLSSNIWKDSFTSINTKRVIPIVGDGNHLPFEDKYFDVVVSVDTVEHIPSESRRKFLLELHRVGKKVILCFPVESSDGLYRAREYDQKFQDAYKRRFGFEEPMTAQHIKSGHPKLEEIKAVLPGARYSGHKNCNIWLEYGVLQQKPVIGFAAGLKYYFHWKKKDNVPPFYEVIVVDEDKPDAKQ